MPWGIRAVPWILVVSNTLDLTTNYQIIKIKHSVRKYIAIQTPVMRK